MAAVKVADAETGGTGLDTTVIVQARATLGSDQSGGAGSAGTWKHACGVEREGGIKVMSSLFWREQQGVRWWQYQWLGWGRVVGGGNSEKVPFGEQVEMLSKNYILKLEFWEKTGARDIGFGILHTDR